MSVLYDSRIEDEFNGWDENQVFELANVMKFIQDEYKYRYRYKYRPNAKIYRENGRLYIEVEGMNERVRVKRL